MTPTRLLDSALIRRRRLTLALSERELATRTCVTGSFIHSVETDRNHPELSAAFLTRLADALGLLLHELFLYAANQLPEAAEADGAPYGHGAEAPAVTPAHVATAGALLTTSATRTPVTVLAEAAGWTLDQTEEVLDILGAKLAVVGMVLQRTSNSVEVMPGATAANATEVTVLTRRTLARTGMNLRQARLLHQVHSGQLTVKDMGNGTRVALGELMNAGLLTWPASARGSLPQLHPDVDLFAAPW